jgi:hypothetical protein
MHSDQHTYWNLKQAMQHYEGPDVFAGVVRPWQRKQEKERRWMESFSKRKGSPVPEATIEDIWRLYAFSRIVELLQLSFAPPDSANPNQWNMPAVNAAEYEEFMDSFGLRKVDAPFHPFFHEIVRVAIADDPRTPIAIVQEYWPAYMLGPMVITRAGCAVTAGANHLNKGIAENSTLYFAYARRNRETHDPSLGWGSNSQWRTTFRRDYLLDGVRHYNVDGKPKRKPDEDLTEADRMELLRYRSFVRCEKDHTNRWPYYDSLIEG